MGNKSKQTKQIQQFACLIAVCVVTGCAINSPTSPAISLETPTPDEPIKVTAIIADATPTVHASNTPVTKDYSGWIVYSAYRDNQNDLYLLSPYSMTIKMGLSELNPTNPTWSPDGNHIAFGSAMGNAISGGWTNDIYIVSTACVDLSEGCLSHAVNLTADDNEGQYRQPDWSPDGTKIAYDYSRNLRSDYVQIWMMNLDGTERSRVSDGYGVSPDWSPDGASIAFDRGGKIVVVGLEEKKEYELALPFDFALNPVWSPDGSQLAFESNQGLEEALGGFPQAQQLFIVNGDGSQLRKVSDNLFGSDITWSPDGLALLFYRLSSQRGLYRINIDGTGLTQLTSDEDGAILTSWLP